MGVGAHALQHAPARGMRTGLAALALLAGLTVGLVGLVGPTILHVALGISLGGAASLWGAGTLATTIGETRAGEA